MAFQEKWYVALLLCRVYQCNKSSLHVYRPKHMTTFVCSCIEHSAMGDGGSHSEHGHQSLYVYIVCHPDM
jgi:hypothetical protein